MSRAKITRLALICGAVAMVAVIVSSSDETADDAQAPLFDLLGDNEIANPIFDDLLEIGADVMAFLMRMVPG